VRGGTLASLDVKTQRFAVRLVAQIVDGKLRFRQQRANNTALENARRGNLLGYCRCSRRRRPEQERSRACDALGAQKQIAGGGRYAEGIGWAIGLDRVLVAEERQEVGL
jgi:hypothetical protein